MFSDYVIEHLPEDPIEALKEVCVHFLQEHAEINRGVYIDHYDDYLRTLALVVSILEGHDLDHNAKIPEIANDVYEDCDNIAEFITDLRRELKERSARLVYESERSLLAIKTGRGFFYEFTDGDLKRLQTLINELRELTVETEDLAEDHKRRLLARLEKVQVELHKKVSDVDRLYGFVGDAGVLLGKLGTNAKPFVDRIRELAEIAWRTQSKKEELPSSSPPPILPSRNDDKSYT